MGIRVGDLVMIDGNHDCLPGLVIKIRKREVATPHTNYRGKYPPVEVKVEKTAEIVWPTGEIVLVNVDSLMKVEKER
tara:strand:- start:565 stop:795 length:231 start_codon:yes stop_codon:yes gene_type:complete